MDGKHGPSPAGTGNHAPRLGTVLPFPRQRGHTVRRAPRRDRIGSGEEPGVGFLAPDERMGNREEVSGTSRLPGESYGTALHAEDGHGACRERSALLDRRVGRCGTPVPGEESGEQVRKLPGVLGSGRSERQLPSALGKEKEPCDTTGSADTRSYAPGRRSKPSGS